jgi:hypothetical protein
MIVHPRRADVRVAEPFLDVGDVGTLIKRFGSRRCPDRVGPESVNRKANLAAVELQNLVDAVCGQRRVGGPRRLFRIGFSRGAEERAL